MVLNSAVNSSGCTCEVVEVLGVVRDADLRHPAVDPAHQAGALVAGEVEAAGLLEVDQQCLELRVGGCHRGPPAMNCRDATARSPGRSAGRSAGRAVSRACAAVEPSSAMSRRRVAPAASASSAMLRNRSPVRGARPNRVVGHPPAQRRLLLERAQRHPQRALQRDRLLVQQALRRPGVPDPAPVPRHRRRRRSRTGCRRRPGSRSRPGRRPARRRSIGARPEIATSASSSGPRRAAARRPTARR